MKFQYNWWILLLWLYRSKEGLPYLATGIYICPVCPARTSNTQIVAAAVLQHSKLVVCDFLTPTESLSE
jgi:hypothetical protein